LVAEVQEASRMTTTASEAPVDLARRFAAAIDDRDWAALADLLSPTFSAVYVHTGERFTAEAFVTLNREYPGAFRFQVEDIVASSTQAVLRARVSPVLGDGDVFYVASFLRVVDGLVEELVEVWSDVVGAQPPPHRSRT
jgi:hypothetical protein